MIRRIGFWVIVAGFAIFWFTSPMATYARDIAHHTVLPVITLAAVTFAGTMLLTRSSMLETLREDYILTARAKGLSESTIRDSHAARNALLPVTTSLVLALAFVIGGGIVTEYIFSWPGVGSLLLESSLREDMPLADWRPEHHRDPGTGRAPDRRHPLHAARPEDPRRMRRWP